LLFRREGQEAHRCTVISLWVVNSQDGVAEYDHFLYAVHDPGNIIPAIMPMTPNPEDLGPWNFEPMETVQAASTPMLQLCG
jgi:hypothetical protein